MLQTFKMQRRTTTSTLKTEDRPTIHTNPSPAKGKVTKQEILTEDDLFKDTGFELRSEVIKEIEEKQTRVRSYLHDFTNRLDKSMTVFSEVDPKRDVDILAEDCTVGRVIEKDMNEAREAINALENKRLKFALTRFLTDYKKILTQNRDPERDAINEELQQFFDMGEDIFADCQEENQEMIESKETVDEALKQMEYFKNVLIKQGQEREYLAKMKEMEIKLEDGHQIRRPWMDVISEMMTILSCGDTRQKLGDAAVTFERDLKILNDTLKAKSKKSHGSKGLGRNTSTMSVASTTSLMSHDRKLGQGAGTHGTQKRGSMMGTDMVADKDLLREMCGKCREMALPLYKEIQGLQSKNLAYASHIKDKVNKVKMMTLQVNKVNNQLNKAMDINGIPGLDQSKGAVKELKLQAQAAVQGMSVLFKDMDVLIEMANEAMLDANRRQSLSDTPNTGIAKELTRVLTLPKDASSYPDFIRNSMYALTRAQEELSDQSHTVCAQAMKTVALDKKILDMDKKLNMVKLLTQGTFARV